MRPAENLLIPCRVPERARQSFPGLAGERCDYRQTMLSFVLSSVEKTEKDRLIQLMLPERISRRLKCGEAFTLSFHEVSGEERTAHKAVLHCMGENTGVFAIGIRASRDSGEEVYDAGSSRMLYIAPREESDEIPGCLGRYFVLHRLEAADTEEALREGHIAAIVLSPLLPPAQAAVLCRMIRPNRSRTEIPVIRACPQKELAGRALLLEAGVSEFIYEPYTDAPAVNTLRAMLRGREGEALFSRLETDQVTVFFTREFFYRYAQQILAAETGEGFCVRRFYFENMSAVVEKAGNAACDLVLEFFANWLRNRMPGFCTGGRMGDHELVALCRGTAEPIDPGLLREAVSIMPVPNITIRVGIAAADSGTPVNILCDHARAAIDSIRQKYGVLQKVFDRVLEQELHREHVILGDMERALETGQFRVYYQPKHRTADARVCGAEALVRWQHPELGLLYPDAFVPLFERTGFIRGLDRNVIGMVCRDILRWQKQGLPVVPVSINLSRRDFELVDLADWIVGLVDSMHISHSILHFELTETAASDDPDRTAACLARLQKEGFAIELDDFGAGYSSLNTLAGLEPDVLKIDKSIVRGDIPGAKRNVFEFCMSLAKLLGVETVAEGVETRAQLERAAALGCSSVQGWY